VTKIALQIIRELLLMLGIILEKKIGL